MSDVMTIPVLPLRDLVMFPKVTTSIGAGRPKTLKALQAASESEDHLVFAVCQRRNVENVTPDRLYTFGTIAKIGPLQHGSRGVQFLLTGEARGIALRISEVEDGGYLQAVVRRAEEMGPTDENDPAFLALGRELRERAEELGERAGMSEEILTQLLGSVGVAGDLADLLSSYLQISFEEKQTLLETLAVEERLRAVLVHVQRQIKVLEAQQDIKDRVQQELGDRQREMVLREQLKAIRKELGEGDEGEEVDDLREKLAELDLPDAAQKEIDRELGRLSRMNKESMEYQVIRTYLETVVELPWTERSPEHLDLGEASQVLDKDHFGLEDVKDRVLEFLAVRQLRSSRKETEGEQPDLQDEKPDEAGGRTAEREKKRTARGPILLFVGPPGVGKTSIARSIARAMGREYVRISLGGARDEADIRGHRRTYVGAMSGRIIAGMKQAGTKNPVFLLDEVDKLGVSFQGDPASALLEVLDPAQNDSFVDHYLGVPFDLSEVLFIATANFLDHIPGPLIDRMEIVEFSGYTEREKLEIARRYLVPRQVEENSLTGEQLTISDEAILEVVSHYTRESGVRQLEREIGKLARKVARKIAAGETDRVELQPAAAGELLGRPKIRPEKAAQADQVGVATGMYYTPAGGDIMFVEVTTMRGKGDLVLTGKLGDVMKESARAAWSWARSNAADLEIPDDRFDQDVHIHVPAGAIPKDGPSAGITMASALVSALSGRPVPHDMAMTGEITLSGRVLPIGGVKEKVLGAVRAGIGTILLPRENEPDLDDIPQHVRDRLTVHPVEQLGDVMKLTVPQTSTSAEVTSGGEGDRKPSLPGSSTPALQH